MIFLLTPSITQQSKRIRHSVPTTAVHSRRNVSRELLAFKMFDDALLVLHVLREREPRLRLHLLRALVHRLARLKGAFSSSHELLKVPTRALQVHLGRCFTILSSAALVRLVLTVPLSASSVSPPIAASLLSLAA